MSSENLLNEVVVSLIATQKSLSDSLKEMSESMKAMKTEMERLKGLDEQVSSLKVENEQLKEKLDTLLNDKQGSLDTDRVPSHALFAKNPFPKAPDGEAIPHPLKGNGKAQISKRLFQDLVEQVYGEEISSSTFNTIWDEVVFKITPSLIKDLKERFVVDKALTFKASGSKVYQEAIKELEEQAFPFMPLRATETSWATKMLLEYCWRHRGGSKRGSYTKIHIYIYQID
jgi:hypothetical protein